MLQEAGITLIFNIKKTLIHRIARCIGAEILHSIDVMMAPTLGSCEEFFVKSAMVPPKTNPEGQPAKRAFCHFVGCPAELGCTLTLCGESYSTLLKVKSVVKHVLRLAYSLKLEAALLSNVGCLGNYKQEHEAELLEKEEHFEGQYRELQPVLFSPGFHHALPSVSAPGLASVYESQYIEFGSCTFCGAHKQEKFACEPCKHEMKEMEYYSSSDTTLLDFLLGNKCFDYNEVCDVHPDEGGGALRIGQEVTHEYTHCRGRVRFITTRLDAALKTKLENVLPVSRERGMIFQPEAQEIYTWGQCKICKVVCGPLPMSEGAKQYSFARYLEQLFHGHSFVCGAPDCGHSVHLDFVRFFARHDTVTRVEYEPVDVFEVELPDNLPPPPPTDPEEQPTFHTGRPSESPQFTSAPTLEASIPDMELSTVRPSDGDASAGEGQTPLHSPGSPPNSAPTSRPASPTSNAEAGSMDAGSAEHPQQDDYGAVISHALLAATMSEAYTPTFQDTNELSRSSFQNQMNTSFTSDKHLQLLLENSNDSINAVSMPTQTPELGSEDDVIIVKVKTLDDDGKLDTTTCTLYFPKLFTKLRSALGQGQDGDVQEAQFISSLSRSKYEPLTGGKAGEFFMTEDNRFIIKMIQRDEKRQFCKTCLEYFRYCEDHISTGTALVQTLGLYRVKRSGSVVSQYLIVLPNLFYSLRMKGVHPRIFDIKGCTYGRRQQNEASTGFEVNLMELTKGSPLALSWNAKVVMMKSVLEDSYFLKQMQVVDYSLLVGVDVSTSTLVVGIVDYCRQYDLKAAAYSLYSRGRTIVEPEAYRNRFCEAMNRYFMYVPAHFEQEEATQAEQFSNEVFK